MPRSIPGANEARGWDVGGPKARQKTGEEVLAGFLVDAIPIITRKEAHDEGTVRALSIPEGEKKQG